MPRRSPRICACGHVVKFGERCACQIKGDQERKARFDASRPSYRARGYDSKWDRARADFLAAHPCCARPGCNQPATIVDHWHAHKGDWSKFWNRKNWVPLCKPCHDGWKQSLEKSGHVPQEPPIF